MAGRKAGSQTWVAGPTVMAALVTVVLAVVVGGLALAGSGSRRAVPPSTAPAAAPTPATTSVRPADLAAGASKQADAYLRAWEGRDWEAMRGLVADPPRDFASQHVVWSGDLEVSGSSFTPGIPTVAGPAEVVVPFAAAITVRGLGAWSYEGELPMVLRDDGWRVQWSPAVLHPLYRPTLTWQVTRTGHLRAPIVDRHGAPLAGTGDIVVIGVEPGRVQEEAAVAAALEEHLGVAPEELDQALREPGVQPDWFLPVAEVTAADFELLDPILRPVPGIVFRRSQARVVASGELAAHLVGTTGDITAELIERLGDPYVAGDQVGRSGLELAYERRLAGVPSGEVRLVDADGKQVLSHAFPGERPQPLRTNLDLTVQVAAERALAEAPEPAALVAVSVADGGVLAAAATPADEFNRALGGRYPPGSTFKIVTAAAAIAAGGAPTDPVECPESLVVDGRTFGNASSIRPGSMTLVDAFAMSCNTAFIGLGGRLSPGQLQEAASRFGFGHDYDLPLPSFPGRFPAPQGPVEQAAAAIGQGRVEASPLHMASVAAAVAAGEWRVPSLIGPSPETRPLDPGVAGALRDMMRAVVERGSGSALDGVPGEVHGKTGSAQFDAALPDETHAWFVGFRDGVAFAVLVERGGSGGGVAAPVAARFLELLGTGPG